MADLASPALPALLPGAVDTAADLALIYDTSVSDLRKITVADLLSLASAAPSGSPLLLDGLPDTNLTATGFQTDTYQAGATITVGQAVHLGSAGKWLESNSVGVATSRGMLAIALEQKNDTQPMKVLLTGFFRNDLWSWTPGEPIYLSAVAGALTAIPPTVTDSVTRVVGFAMTADVIWFAPSPDYLTHV
jgi:hypothetical protein